MAFDSPTLFTESISARTATPSVDIGEQRTQNGKEYIYVYNGSSNEQIDVGRGVKIASQSVGYTVDVAIGAPSTITAALCFGVCQDATFATGDYGWLQQRGFAAALQCGGGSQSTVVTGEAFYISTSGLFRRYSNVTVDGNAAQNPVGQAVSGSLTTTSVSTFGAYINTK